MYTKFEAFRLNDPWFDIIEKNEDEETQEQYFKVDKEIDEDGNINFVINIRPAPIGSSIFENHLNIDFSTNKIDNLRSESTQSLYDIDLNHFDIFQLYKKFIFEGSTRFNLDTLHFDLNDLSKETVEKINKKKKIKINENIFKKREKIKFKKCKI
jgi:hypothetical protein